MDSWLDHGDVTLYHGDCLEVMVGIPDASVDMVLCDLPYGTTQNAWDSTIDLPALWEQYRRIAKPAAAFVLTAQQPFTTTLAASNLGDLKYEWIWEKQQGTGFLNAARAPLKNHENVLVFYRSQPIYNPQMRPAYLRKQTGRIVRSEKGSSNYGKMAATHTVKEGPCHPVTVVAFDSEPRTESLHPTQKPVLLFAHMIRTYTNEGDTVLDNCIGSGTTAVAARLNGRRCIGIDSNEDYLRIAEARLAQRSLLDAVDAG